MAISIKEMTKTEDMVYAIIDIDGKDVPFNYSVNFSSPNCEKDIKEQVLKHALLYEKEAVKETVIDLVKIKDEINVELAKAVIK